MQFTKATLACATILAACSNGPATPAGAQATEAPSQRAEGLPYEILGTEVHDLTDLASGLNYQVFVSLPPSYDKDSAKRFPVVFVTDADYGFPMLRLIGRRMNGAGPKIEEFILVGLSYEKGQDPMASRRRDYTPTPRGASDAPAGALHGQSLRYRDYIRTAVIPFIESRYRTRPDKRIYVGHSYGGLLGAEILLTDPTMFSGYVLGSPSFWFDKRHLLKETPRLLDESEPLAAKVYMYAGEFEAQRIGDRRYQQEVDMVVDNATFAAMLNGRDFPELALTSEVFEEEDHLSVAPRGFTRGLLTLLPAQAAR
ncbi:alpha/beta hydrolase [Altererythrobacter sp. GH1-8]|uniref:alpha/beta hydrolase n=1 Tax=Altererythrobacter sp. GH1-8 TaxID=3349333 RepID=UPI00374DBEFD